MKAECQRARAQLLEAFAAGAALEGGLGAHLAVCAECREQVEGWQQTAMAVRRWRVAVPAGLREETLLRLRGRGERLRQRRQALQLLAAAGVISAVVNAASFRLIWMVAGLLRQWLGWPEAAQTAMLAAWALSPLVLAGLVLWLMHSHPMDGTLPLEDFSHE